MSRPPLGPPPIGKSPPPLPISEAEVSRLKILKNPFRGAVVGDPWEATVAGVEVPAIHGAVFKVCCEAVELVRRGACSAGIVIHGSPGSGKTHLIGRLRRRLIDSQVTPTHDHLSQAFAYVRLNTNASSLARLVRRSVASDLLRKKGTELSQFERLVIARLMEIASGEGDIEQWWEYFINEREDELEGLMIEFGLREGLSPKFVRVLQHLVRKQHRLDVAGWLQGDSLLDRSYELLGISPEEPEDDPEVVAMQALKDFMRLAGSHVPLVLCFDQVEALQATPNDDQALFCFGKLVAELHDADTNLVLISCMQSSLLERFKSVIPGYAFDRMKGHAVNYLNPLNEAETRALLKNRLQASGVSEHRPESADDLWPLCESELPQLTGEIGRTPRELLDKAASRFDQLTHASPQSPRLSQEQWLQSEWERRTDLATQANQHEQTTEILRHAVPHLVNLVEPRWKTSSGTAKSLPALDYLLSAPQNEARVGVKFCEADGTRLAAQLRQLVNLPSGEQAPHKLVLLRDERRPISKGAAKTLEYLKVLEQKDAVFFRVPPEALSALDALRQLLADAQAGDLDFQGETVMAEPVMSWLRENLPGVLKEMADLLVTPQRETPSPTWVETLQEYLAEHRLVRASHVATDLNVPLDELLTIAEKRVDLFGVLRGETSVLFSARLGSRCLTTS